VTFTEAAAAELRERIRAELLDRGRGEDALRLDQAYISTIHGFGLRVLTEFAFEAGISPQPRLLNEDEQDALVRRALTRTDKTDPIVSDLEAYGYRYDFNTGKSAGELFRDDLLRIVELLRSVGCENGMPRFTRSGRLSGFVSATGRPVTARG
jgi:ATP-dependent helicase/nuclease subunit A